MNIQLMKLIQILLLELLPRCNRILDFDIYGPQMTFQMMIAAENLQSSTIPYQVWDTSKKGLLKKLLYKQRFSDYACCWPQITFDL